MKSFTAVIERDSETGYLVGYVPSFPGAHSQGATVEELRDNLRLFCVESARTSTCPSTSL